MTLNEQLNEIRRRLGFLEAYVGLEPAAPPPLDLGAPQAPRKPLQEPPGAVVHWIVWDRPVAAPSAFQQWDLGEHDQVARWRWADPVGDLRSAAERFNEACSSALRATAGRPLWLVLEPANWQREVRPAQRAQALWRWLAIAAARGLELERPAAGAPEESAAVAAFERDILGRSIVRCAILASGEVWVDAQ